MSRLQKKCILATAGFHLLLLVILLVGPAFFTSKPKPDDSQVLDVIPANILDNALNSGVRGATPPPTPVATPQPPTPAPTPTPVAPQPRPAPTPVPQKVVERPDPVTPVKSDPTPVVKPTKAETQKIKVNLTLTERTAPKPSTQPTKTSDDSAKQARAIKNALNRLKNHLSSSTVINVPGENSEAYAGYDQAVLSIYDNAWISPESMKSSEADVRVRITISRDGTVISSAIIDPSGDPQVDKSVQQALNRVTRVIPFPEGSKEEQRTIEINFKPRSKSLLG